MKKHRVLGMEEKANRYWRGCTFTACVRPEPNHDVSPWLAGLFVVREHRRKGAGAILVRAVGDQARQRGFSRLYLYTTDAVGFYARLGWSNLDHTHWKGFDTALMVRDLSQPGADKENAA